MRLRNSTHDIPCNVRFGQKTFKTASENNLNDKKWSYSYTWRRKGEQSEHRRQNKMDYSRKGYSCPPPNPLPPPCAHCNATGNKEQPGPLYCRTMSLIRRLSMSALQSYNVSVHTHQSLTFTEAEHVYLTCFDWGITTNDAVLFPYVASENGEKRHPLNQGWESSLWTKYVWWDFLCNSCYSFLSLLPHDAISLDPHLARSALF